MSSISVSESGLAVSLRTALGRDLNFNPATISLNVSTATFAAPSKGFGASSCNWVLNVEKTWSSVFKTLCMSDPRAASGASFVCSSVFGLSLLASYGPPKGLGGLQCAAES